MARSLRLALNRFSAFAMPLPKTPPRPVFIAVPDPKLAEEHLRTLTQAPHMAGTAEDKATADYVAAKFRAAGLDTEIVEYKVMV